jgi:hypothetical protein
MNHDLHDLESSLAGLRPSRADQALLERLESAADGSLTELTVSELRLESLLSGHRPAALPAEFFASLEKVVASTPFPVGEKIVMFTKGSVAPKNIRRFRPMAAAAAVALLGGMTALMMPTGMTTTKGGEPIVSNPVPAKLPGGFVPASYGNNVQTASDEGVVWMQNRPHRVVRVIYNERATFINSEGKRVEVEQSLPKPRVEYILVPEKID